jgi:2-oxo-4-hydroxy-4-carboxy-5-ureidoimidazoline decarboxylase
MKLSIEQINNLSKNDFVAHFAHVVEHSPWVAEQAYDKRPFKGIDDLYKALCQSVLSADESVWKHILNLHPELSGKEAQEGSLTNFSTAEQSGLGLNSLPKEEFQQIQVFNRDYREKFGFPFVVCVRNLASKSQLFSEMQRRLSLAGQDELRTGLEQVLEICRLRLNDLVLVQAEKV